MLIHCKTSIKTTFLLLLFTAGGIYLFAGSSNLKNQSKNPDSEQFSLLKTDYPYIPDLTNLFSSDTIPTGTPIERKGVKEEEFIVPTLLNGKTFDFQVNSDISYLSYSHFVKTESKKMFFLAWLKDRELKRISSQTDSLRKVYANYSGDRKEEVSSLILKAEERIIALNEEIPILYEKVRDNENQYWQLASAGEIAKFQEKIRLFKDSVQQNAGLQSGQPTTINQKSPEINTIYKSPQKAVIKTDAQSVIIYKIQVGAYKGKVPDSAVKSIKKLSVLRKVENYKDEKGVTIYTTGNLKNYQEAVTMQKQIKQEGIKNAIIVAFQNGKRITENEARKIQQ